MTFPTDSTLAKKVAMKILDHDISIYNDAFLAKSIETRMKATGCATRQEYEAMLERDQGEDLTFLDSLHISYSEFFRNSLTFSVLEHIVLPKLIRNARETGRREIRIWSAGCAGGQEPYSIAILLEELIKNNCFETGYRIFASDVNKLQVRLARAGVFSEESMSNVTRKRLSSWFIRNGQQYAVHPELAEHIEFSEFDMLDSGMSCPPQSIFGGFDLVFCCNILFYYKQEQSARILSKIANCLGRDAYLVTGEAERGFVTGNSFKEAFPQSAIFQKI
jgi:chemotaxis methyl-accepting protein methylase